LRETDGLACRARTLFTTGPGPRPRTAVLGRQGRARCLHEHRALILASVSRAEPLAASDRAVIVC